MSFVSKTFHVLILTCTAYEIYPVKEESQKGLNKPIQGLEALLTLENLCHKLLPGPYQKQLFFFHEEGKVGASFSSPYLLHSSKEQVSLDSDFWLPSTRGLIQKETHWQDFLFLTFSENESNRLSPAHTEGKAPTRA